MFPTIERAPRRSRYSSATWYPAAGLAGLRRRRVLVDFDAVLRAATDPAASNSATRVSPRSTLTNTCFFNAHSVLYGSLRTFAEEARALRARSSGRTRAAPSVVGVGGGPHWRGSGQDETIPRVFVAAVMRACTHIDCRRPMAIKVTRTE